MKRENELQRLLARGQITRRQFVERATAIGVAAAAIPAMMSKAAQAAPKKGGRLRLGSNHGSTTDSTDPATFENGFSIVFGYALRNHLTEVDNSGQLVPDLSSGWESSPDASKWVFKLRPGVEFHNGKTMDSADVVASFNHHRGDDSKSAAKSLLDQVSEMKADGKDTVVFQLKTGNADFPYIASDYHIAIMPADGSGKVDWKSGVGTGGYMLESYDPGVRATFKRNPNYFKEGRAHFDEAEMLTVADAAARTNALTTGEVDVIDRVDLKTVNLLKRKPGIKVEQTSSTAHYSVPMITTQPPFDNNDVRLALKYALDREALLKTVLRGYGTVGNDHPISPANRYHAGDLPQRTYDLDKAKFHLKKAGLSELTVPLHTSEAAFAGANDASVLYKEHAAAAGINIEVIPEPEDGYWANVWMKKPWSMCYWGGRPTEDWMFSVAYAADANWNDTFWKHDRFNQLLVAARAELDEDKRRQMYFEMQQICSDEGGVVVPVFNNYVFASSDKIAHDPVMAGNWDLDGAKMIERWWFG